MAVNTVDQPMQILRTKILGLTLLLGGLVLCGAGLWLLLSPAQYQATVRIKREPNSGGVDTYQPVKFSLTNPSSGRFMSADLVKR